MTKTTPELELLGTAARLRIGALSVTVFSDGHLDLPAAAFFDLPEGMAAPSDPIRFGANLWHVSTGNRQIMIDAGSGALLSGRFPETGHLAAHMQTHDIDPGAINDVILTHMHPDHIGGLMTGQAELFPNAALHVARTEWDHWTDPSLPDRTSSDRRAGVEAVQAIAARHASRLRLHDGGENLGDGVHLVPAPGHTPGHMAVLLRSQDMELMLLGDAILHPALQTEAPQIGYALDHDPALAVQTRLKLLTELCDTGRLCAATHFAFPGIGYIRSTEDRFTFEPLTGQP